MKVDWKNQHYIEKNYEHAFYIFALFDLDKKSQAKSRIVVRNKQN